MTVSGTPSALVLEVPKLEVMSFRTTPEAARTFGPLEPSPGYGPAVSSGISTPHSAIARVSVGEAEAAEEGVPVATAVPEAAGVGADVAVAPAAADEPPAEEPPGVHAARAAAAPALRNMPSERRLRSVERSNSRPRSWLGCGSCGGCGVVVMRPCNPGALCPG